MTLNGVMAVTLRYFTEFGKPAFQHIMNVAHLVYLFLGILKLWFCDSDIIDCICMYSG